MIIESILMAATIVVSGVIMVVNDWKWRMACLSFFQLIAFLLVVQIWPVALAAVKLIAGWIGISIISAAMARTEQDAEAPQNISFTLYKLAMASITWIAILVLVPRLNTWLPISFPNLFSGMVFFLCGFLFLSIHEEMIETIIGLYILLAGFDIVYSSLEGSALVTGVYAVILISISILGGYLQGGFSSGGEA
jgi:hypothetical protein